jgi:hypothetical protein
MEKNETNKYPIKMHELRKYSLAYMNALRNQEISFCWNGEHIPIHYAADVIAKMSSNGINEKNINKNK